MWKSHNEPNIIKVPPKNISKEIRYDSNQLYHKTQKKFSPDVVCGVAKKEQKFDVVVCTKTL